MLSDWIQIYFKNETIDTSNPFIDAKNTKELSSNMLDDPFMFEILMQNERGLKYQHSAFALFN